MPVPSLGKLRSSLSLPLSASSRSFLSGVATASPPCLYLTSSPASHASSASRRPHSVPHLARAVPTTRPLWRGPTSSLVPQEGSGHLVDACEILNDMTMVFTSLGCLVTPCLRGFAMRSQAWPQLRDHATYTAQAYGGQRNCRPSYNEVDLLRLGSSLSNNGSHRETPFPQIRGARLERMFFSAPDSRAQCKDVYRVPPTTPLRGCPEALWYPASKSRKVTVADVGEEVEGFEEGSIANGERGHGATMNLDFLDKGSGSDKLPPQTVLVRVLRELEDDFTHYKGIYTELADQYEVMDTASNIVKRNTSCCVGEIPWWWWRGGPGWGIRGRVGAVMVGTARSRGVIVVGSPHRLWLVSLLSTSYIPQQREDSEHDGTKEGVASGAVRIVTGGNSETVELFGHILNEASRERGRALGDDPPHRRWSAWETQTGGRKPPAADDDGPS
ncbi:hypothetical protein EDB84DRAFT_1677911 [Lactarius hengduanensis]|nr:hypothetical protein EDB84DRAFT_1677911 [Lactarius hengduanensis]